MPWREKEMVTQSSTLAWRIPWTEEPGGLQSTGSQRVGHDCVTEFHFSMKWISRMHTYIPSPLDLPSMAPHQSHPSRSSQSTELSPLCYIAASHQLSVFKWQCTHVSLKLPIHLHPLHTHMSISCPAVEYNFISRRQCISWRWVYIF